MVTFHNVIILINSIVNKNENKYYYNIFLQKGLYKYKAIKQYSKCVFVYYKGYIMTFLKQAMIIKQVHQKSVIFLTITIF